jgi:predicted TPR repeat methyltransferase
VASAKDGDWRAAEDLFAQTLELTPGWAPAHFALAEAREKLGQIVGAAGAYRASLAADPSDAQGAAARLAMLEGGSPESLPPAYVARLFDDYAPRFDAHLTGALSYRGPELILAALEEAAPGRGYPHALDLGCGTGLMGKAIRPRVGRLVGVDISPAMVAKADERGAYDRLVAGDALAFLDSAERSAFDLILAADAFCYFGDLEPILAASARALARHGLIAFSVETEVGGSVASKGFRLRPTMRFAHGPAYVSASAERVGLRPLVVRPDSIRREVAADASGLIAVFERVA